MKFDAKKLLKWTPVVSAGVIATGRGIMERREADQIDDMGERIAGRGNKEGP